MLASHADVLTGSSRNHSFPTCDEPLRMSAWDATHMRAPALPTVNETIKSKVMTTMRNFPLKFESQFQLVTEMTLPIRIVV